MVGPQSPDLDEATLAYPGWRVVLVCFAMALVCWGFGFYGLLSGGAAAPPRLAHHTHLVGYHPLLLRERPPGGLHQRRHPPARRARLRADGGLRLCRRRCRA